jgi:hypothetical protein
VRGDFMDRIVEYQLERIPGLERKGDEEVKALMASFIPKVRWAAWVAISRAMTLKDVIKAEQKEKPRNADFAVWGEAISRALGYEPFQFYNRLMEKSLTASQTSVAEDTVAGLIMKAVDRDPAKAWVGTASELLETLRASDPNARLPSNGSHLGILLNKIRLDMQNAGYLIEKAKVGAVRNITISTVEAAKAARLDVQTNLVPATPPEDRKNTVPAVLLSHESDGTATRDSKLDSATPAPVWDSKDSKEKLLSQTSQGQQDSKDSTSLKEGGKGRAGRFFRCMDCGAGVYTDEKQCDAHKALKGNEGHLFMEFDTIQAANRFKPGGAQS